MFDIGWAELLLIAAAALIIVGPKELPLLLRTIGRYIGIIRSHANEFRAQFEEAIREAQFDDVKNEMTELRDDVANTMRDADASADERMREAKRALSAAGPDSRTHLKTPSDAKNPETEPAPEPAQNDKDGT